MNKFTRILIIINGLILPFFILFILYNLVTNIFRDSHPRYEDPSLIVGVDLEKANEEQLALQGLDYINPEKFYYEDMYCMPISVRTFEEVKDLHYARMSAGNINPNSFNNINFVFLDKDFNVIRTLLSEKASIKEAEIPTGHLYNVYSYDEDQYKHRKINTYQIAFKDTNNDGKLNYADEHDLYISDLDGDNLKQITSNIDIETIEFINKDSEIFISYYKRNDHSKEHKRLLFKVYDISKGELKELSSIEKQLDIIEQQIRK